MTKYRALLLDLDGTLVDSLPGIEESLSYAMDEIVPGSPRIPLRDLVGPPVAVMFDKYLEKIYAGWSAQERVEIVKQLLPHFRRAYDTQGFANCHYFPGVKETLAALKAQGVQNFIVTNKRAVPTKAIARHLQMESFLDGILCSDSLDKPFEDKAGMVHYLMEKFGLDYADILFVGDSPDDAHGAAANRVHFAAVTYGYGNVHLSPDYTFHHVIQDFNSLVTIVGNGKSD